MQPGEASCIYIGNLV